MLCGGRKVQESLLSPSNASLAASTGVCTSVLGIQQKCTFFKGMTHSQKSVLGIQFNGMMRHFFACMLHFLMVGVKRNPYHIITEPDSKDRRCFRAKITFLLSIFEAYRAGFQGSTLLANTEPAQSISEIFVFIAKYKVVYAPPPFLQV